MRAFLKANPIYLQKVSGFFPAADTIVDLVEHKIGPVGELNLVQANRESRLIVEDIARPKLLKFVQDSLGAKVQSGNITFTLSELMSFLIDDFSEFQRQAGNGLVSVAGKLNEELLVRALFNSGLELGSDFLRTGQNSDGDIVVRSNAGTKENLGVEIKSYHARERLLRGLQDVSGNKVGVGYFQDAKEFNFKRSQTLLQAQPSAIYMPQSTLDHVDAKSRALTTNSKIAFQSALYRPLERFATDMAHYVKTGQLPSTAKP